MSSSDAQPPLSRREARERERAAAAGGQPVTPPPTVAAPTDPTEARRRPGSHVAPSPSGPAQSAARPASGSAPRSADDTDRPASAPQSGLPVFPLTPAPASATEIVPGTGGLTRRQLRLMREAEGQAVQPVPLQPPTPQSSDRTVQDVIGSVDRLDDGAQPVRPVVPSRPTPASAAPSSAVPSSPAAEQDAPVSGRSSEVPLAATPALVAAAQTEAAQSDAAQEDAAQSDADDSEGDDDAAAASDATQRPVRAGEPPAETEVLDAAAVAQATEADGSPDALEPLSEAAAHAEEPRRHRSTWAPPEGDESATDPDAPSATDSDTGAAAGDTDDATDPAGAAPSAAVPSPSTPVVFPLSLDDDTNEVPVQRPTPATARRDDDTDDAPRVPAAFDRRSEPKPVTTAFRPSAVEPPAFEPPAGHWSQQAHDSNDAEVHDATRRVAVRDTNSIVLPDSALADPTGALNATGEVILTGSIDLPASLSSTGSHRPIDGAEVDRLLEQHDEQPETDASPVRASRAVSSHTSTRQVVLAAAKPKESRTPVILGVTVGAVGLAAAGVIIVALLTTHFGG